MGTTPSRITPSRGIDYHRDLYEWAMANARLLRAGRLSEIDLVNIAEELEDMGRSDRRALLSHLRNLLAHLLKWQYQPQRRGPSWRLTIRGARDEIEVILDDSPSLKRVAAHSLESVYAKARKYAADETGMNEAAFPEKCPYGLDELLHDAFLPKA